MHYTGQQAVNAANERANEDILPTCSSFLGRSHGVPSAARWLALSVPVDPSRSCRLQKMVVAKGIKMYCTETADTETKRIKVLKYVHTKTIDIVFMNFADLN